MTEQTVETEPVTDEQTTETEQPEGDTFDRAYVETLRKEAGDHRVAAKAAADALTPLQQRLHAALVASSGRLADASDLAFDASHLESEEALTAAIDALLTGKPHLASRRVVGDVGQGAGGDEPAGVNLAGLLAARA